MSKKKKDGAKAAAGAYGFTATLTIEGGVLSTADNTIQTFAGGPVVWIVVNKDDLDYTVAINYSEIVKKSDKKKKNPFPKGKTLNVAVVGPKGYGSMVAITDSEAARILYKYTVQLFQNGDEKKPLDPDLDVVDPGSIIITP